MQSHLLWIPIKLPFKSLCGFKMPFETGGVGRRDNAHSTYAAKFRKVLCSRADERADEDSKEGARVTTSPEGPEAGAGLRLLAEFVSTSFRSKESR